MFRDLREQFILKLVLHIEGRPHASTPKKLKKILIVRLDALGDMVLSTPFIREIRRTYPYAHISLIVRKDVYELFELCPYVNEIYGYESAFKNTFLKSFLRMKKFIREQSLEGYDLAIVPRWDSDYGYFAGLLAFLSHATNRIGYSENVNDNKKKSDKGYDSFYTGTIASRSPVEHEVERGLDIVNYLGSHVKNRNLELWCSEEDRKKALFLLDYENRKYKTRIALFMTAGSRRREWDTTHFKEVIGNILRSEDCQFVLMGSGNEAEAKALDIKKYFSGDEVLNLTGKTTLRETYAVLKLCDVYLGGDTGPMHMAVAAGLKGVVLSCHPITGILNHDNSPARFGPWNDNQMTVLRPKPMPGCEDGCNHNEAHCINNISVSDVCEELKQYLG